MVVGLLPAVGRASQPVPDGAAAAAAAPKRRVSKFLGCAGRHGGQPKQRLPPPKEEPEESKDSDEEQVYVCKFQSLGCQFHGDLAAIKLHRRACPHRPSQQQQPSMESPVKRNDLTVLWSDEEHQQFEQALRQYGGQWEAVGAACGMDAAEARANFLAIKSRINHTPEAAHRLLRPTSTAARTSEAVRSPPKLLLLQY
jgi:hypothetical protein